MRIQDKFRALISPWIISAFLILLLTFSLIYAVCTANVKHRIYGLQYHELNIEFDRLKEINEQLKNTKAILHLDDKRLSTILALLIRASNKSGLDIGEVSIGTECYYNSNKALPVNIMGKGNYNQIGRFINNLEHEDARIQFNEIELSTKETKGLDIICKLKGYFIIL